jgi:hypothetical protein
LFHRKTRFIRHTIMLDLFKTRIDSKIHGMRRLLKRPVEVTAEGAIVLGRTASERREQARRARSERERPMRHELFDLLEQHPSSRQLMRHLDLVERTLRTRGISGVETLPTRVIAKALEQLERLVWDWSAVGLAEMRSRMAVIVKTRPIEAPDAAMSTRAAALDLLQSTDVSEVDHSAFEEMQRSWSDPAPMPLAAAQ